MPDLPAHLNSAGAGAGAGARPDGHVLLTDWGLLKVHGADAATFLQAQLTNDVLALAPGDVRLAGYCSVKGRLLASFWIWREADAGDGAPPVFWLACSRDLAPALAKRLGMYVLRAKVRVEEASDSWSAIGLVRVAGPSRVGALGGRPLPAVALEPAISALLPELSPARTSAAGVSPAVAERAVLLMPAAARFEALASLAGQGSAALAPEVWRRLDVLSGVARIEAANQDLFVPQMVNFERTGGVSFSKGCYPGQEVVARSQYLGKLKRRMYLGIGSGPVPAVGADVARLDPVPEPIGHVVQAAALAGNGGFVALFECRTDALAVAAPVTSTTPSSAASTASMAAVRIGEAPVALLPLPYASTDAVSADAA